MKKTIACFISVIALLPSFITPTAAAEEQQLSDIQLLDTVGKGFFNYFIEATNPVNGLVMDKTSNRKTPDFKYSPATVAGVGFGLAVLPIGVERGWISRADAAKLAETTLRFFADKMESEHGFFYHFVDMETGKRVWNCELSSIDSALFFAGALTAASYFTENDIPALADKLYRRADWQWMTNGGELLTGGWTPEKGFLTHRWHQYDESSVMYILAMGSPTHPLKGSSWKAITRIVGEYKGRYIIMCPPLFTHQFSHAFIDFRDKSDGLADYFENSVQATLINRQFCMDNAQTFKTYGPDSWGLTASIGPDGYNAYGAPPGPASHDGTVAPSAAAASMPFTPELSISAVRNFYYNYGDKLWGRYGFTDSFNIDRNFYAEDAYALNQGIALLMMENHRTGLIWKLFMTRPEIERGMKAAGFGGEYVKLNRTALPFARTAVYYMENRPLLSVPALRALSRENGADMNSAVWDSAAEITLDDKTLSEGLEKQPDYKVSAKVLADSDNLYIRVAVADKEIVSVHPDENLYEDDAVEIYLDTLNNNFRWNGKDDYQLVLSPGTKGMRAREMLHPQATEGKFRILDQKTDSNGYGFVLALDRKDFSIGSARLGFSVAAHNKDVKAGSNAKYNWFFLIPAVHLGSVQITEAE